jgi:hypothetical protein
MSEWKPKPKPDAQLEDLNLTGEEGYVLSRVDGFTSVHNLVAVTGLPEVRVKQILKKLVRSGALHDDADMAPSAPAAPEPALRTGRPAAPPSTKSTANTGGPSKAEIMSTLVDELSPAELREILGETDHTMDDAPALAQMTETDHQGGPHEPSAPAPIELGGGVEEAQIDAPEPVNSAFEEPTMADDPNAEAADAKGDDADKGEEKADEEAAENPDEEANFRKLYNTELSKLEQPEREAMAKTAKDPYLAALCFDAHPAVIKQIFDNQSAGLQHARLVARNHHTPQGLDVVMHRAEFFRDGQTQRLLLQNTMLQEPQLKRILQSKRLMECYKITISREIPERNRQKARHVLRSKWSTSDAEERAGLVFTTEGRCLIQLTGLPFDSHTTTLLCSKTYTSLLLIQNLARFGASPPQVLAHLLKQAPVKRQPHLRTLITQHPNCPADAKRRA